MAKIKKGTVTNTEISSDDFQEKIRLDLEYWYKILKVAAIAAPIFYVFIHATYFYNFGGAFSSEKAEWGTFGDFIGGSLNPVFSLLAFLALIYTIKLQSVELRNSAEQLKKSADALATQNAHWDRQNFESTFFNLIDNYRRQMERLRFVVERNGTKKEYDQNQMDVHAKDLIIKVERKISSIDKNEQYKVKIRLGFNKLIGPLLVDFFKGEGNYLIRLCDGIFLIMHFIDRSSLTESEKRFYFEILEKQISIAELSFLFFYSVGANNQTFEMLKKYGVFEAWIVTSKEQCVLTDIKNEIFKLS